MILAQLQRQPDRPVTLFWGLQPAGSVLAGYELVLAAIHPTLTVVAAPSRPEPGWQGASGRHGVGGGNGSPSVRNLAVYLAAVMG